MDIANELVVHTIEEFVYTEGTTGQSGALLMGVRAVVNNFNIGERHEAVTDHLIDNR